METFRDDEMAPWLKACFMLPEKQSLFLWIYVQYLLITPNSPCKSSVALLWILEIDSLKYEYTHFFLLPFKWNVYWNVLLLYLNIFYLFFILTTVFTPSSVPVPFLLLIFLPAHPFLLCLYLHSERDRTLMGLNKTCYMKLRQDSAPLLVYCFSPLFSSSKLSNIAFLDVFKFLVFFYHLHVSIWLHTHIYIHMYIHYACIYINSYI